MSPRTVQRESRDFGGPRCTDYPGKSATSVAPCRHFTDRRHAPAGRLRGAARLFVDEYRTVGLYLERVLQNDVWEPIPRDALIRLSDAD